MNLEIKVIAGAVLFLILGVATYLGVRSVFEAGVESGKAAKQLEFNQFKTDTQAAADKQVIAIAKDRDAALANNEDITRDLTTQLSASQSNADSLVKRVSDYQAQLSASISALRQASSDKDAAVASGISRAKTELNQAIAAYDAGCQRDAIRLDKLTAELTPQL